jgi:hypothetical protein
LLFFTSTCGGAFFASVTPQAAFEKGAAVFSKVAKTAPKQVRSPPAEEAKAMNVKPAFDQLK